MEVEVEVETVVETVVEMMMSPALSHESAAGRRIHHPRVWKAQRQHR